MLRKAVRSLIIWAAIGTSMCAMALPASAHAAPSSSAPIVKCHTLAVHLNGTQPATSMCMDGYQSAGGKVQPYNPVTTGCAGKDLWIYDNANQSGDRICFSGTGWANMTDYCLYYWPWGSCRTTWNDQASSFWAGCSDGGFAQDIDGGGNREAFFAYEKNNFDGVYPRLADKTMSSFALNYNC